MYAIIETGGKQIKVETGDVIFVEKLEVEAGETYTFDKVLLVGDETVSIGTPYVEGATVEATVEKQGKEKKASDACAVFPLGDAIRKGKLYQVRFKARGNQPMTLGTAMKQRHRPYAYVGLKTETVQFYSITSTEKMYEYQLRATKSFASGECVFHFFFGGFHFGFMLFAGFFKFRRTSVFFTIFIFFMLAMHRYGLRAFGLRAVIAFARARTFGKRRRAQRGKNYG